MIECFYFGMKYLRIFKQSYKKVFVQRFKLLREREKLLCMIVLLALLYVPCSKCSTKFPKPLADPSIRKDRKKFISATFSLLSSKYGTTKFQLKWRPH